MDAKSLVTLKSRKISLVDESSQTKFIPNEHYRCMESEGGYIVYGVFFDKGTFDNMFEFLHDRMLSEWSENGLLPNMKPLSKSKFIEVVDVHQYGKGKNKLWIGLVGTKMSGLWAFQCLCKGDTKVRFLSQAYEMYQTALNGDMEDIDDELLQRGNSGIPISFGDIYFKKEWSSETDKREIYC
jgi:hypothetical protein